jgi:hypothetical protein
VFVAAVEGVSGAGGEGFSPYLAVSAGNGGESVGFETAFSSEVMVISL